MMTPDEAIEFGNELLYDIQVIKERVFDSELPESAHDYAESVDSTVDGIVTWIDTNSHVTEKQESSLNNIREAVDKWLVR